MAVTVKKIKTYYCEGLVDGWVDVKDNGEIEVYGFDYSKYTIDQIKDLSLFLQYVYEDNELHKKFEQEDKWVDLTQEEVDECFAETQDEFQFSQLLAYKLREKNT